MLPQRLQCDLRTYNRGEILSFLKEEAQQKCRELKHKLKEDTHNAAYFDMLICDLKSEASLVGLLNAANDYC